jgi:cell division protein FtsL
MFVMIALAAVFACTSVSAQKINTDSLSLVSKISADQLKLAKLQNTLDETTRDKQDYATAAQQSADKNKRAAGRLSDDPTDKKEARKADNAAGDARSDAKKARKASDKLRDLNKNIAELKSRIAENQQKLNAYIPVTSVTGGISPAVDSTHHD